MGGELLPWAHGLRFAQESGGNLTPKFLGKLDTSCHGLLRNCQLSLISAVDLTSQLEGNGSFHFLLIAIFPLLFPSLSVPLMRQEKDDKAESEGRIRADISARIFNDEKEKKAAPKEVPDRKFLTAFMSQPLTFGCP